MQVSLPAATTQTKMWFVNPCNPEEKSHLEHSEPREGQHSPAGRHSQALPPLASFRRGFPRPQNPSPHTDVAAVHARGGTGQGQRSATEAKGCYSLERREAQAGDGFVIHSLS